MARRKKLLDLDDHIILLDDFDDLDNRLKDEAHQKLLERSEVDAESGCVVYTGAWEEDGHAKMRVGARVYPVSRVVAWIYKPGFKIWGDNRSVRTCRTPACCNPDHHKVVRDQAAAKAQQMRRGLLPRAESPLTREKVARMRELFAQGATFKELAAGFRCKVPAVRDAVTGKTWTHDFPGGILLSSPQGEDDEGVTDEVREGPLGGAKILLPDGGQLQPAQEVAPGER